MTCSLFIHATGFVLASSMVSSGQPMTRCGLAPSTSTSFPRPCQLPRPRRWPPPLRPWPATRIIQNQPVCGLFFSPRPATIIIQCVKLSCFVECLLAKHKPPDTKHKYKCSVCAYRLDGSKGKLDGLPTQWTRQLILRPRPATRRIQNQPVCGLLFGPRPATRIIQCVKSVVVLCACLLNTSRLMQSTNNLYLEAGWQHRESGWSAQPVEAPADALSSASHKNHPESASVLCELLFCLLAS